MKRVLIFGAAGVGELVKKHLEKEGMCISAFSDNNPDKWNSYFCGVIVIPPDSICISEYDIFAIGVYKARDSIKQQLLNMGVSEGAIIIPEEATRIVYNNSIRTEHPSENEKYTIAMILGGIETICEEERKDVLYKGKLVKRFDFKSNYWGFKLFLEDCITTLCESEYSSFWAKKCVTDYSPFILDVVEIWDDDHEIINKYINHSNFLFFDGSLIKQIIENENTFEFWNSRYPRDLPPELLLRIDELKACSQRYNFPLEDVMVVSGAVLEAYGLREGKKHDDLDIVMTECFRELYGRDLVVVSENIEMHPQNELDDLSDEEMITNPHYHFYVRGVKFETIDICERKKRRIESDEVNLIVWWREDNENIQ